jgi:acyl transferase domain-containing protein
MNISDESNRSRLEKALLAIQTLQARLMASERSRNEPIAVVGLGCRFPGGADDPESFWRLLAGGVDAVREVPPDRWDVDAWYDPDPNTPGKTYTRYGAFLEQVDRFDPALFGIAPREAVSLDPQQRLLLEVAWEALENAGVAPAGLAGSSTGVFVGICSSDYCSLLLDCNPETIDPWLGTGVAHSVAAGRISYVLGLQGPSLAIDTACSSSLVAVHAACQSLRGGECGLALAGGVNVILRPEIVVNFCKSRMLAPDGRCKVFDAAADGFVRGEGCGVVVLERLYEAQANGHRILAVIRGSAVNQDGHSSGLTAPNGPSQEAVIRQALGAAGLKPADIRYVEAHGTGTSLGDPIEVQALGAALGEGRPADQPLLIGSVKTNIGHLEGASGIAGLLKVMLSLQHGEIPAHLHFNEPSPCIPWNELPVAVPRQPIPWPATQGRRIAGVSSFGFSGTNAHVIVEQAPPPAPVNAGDERSLHLLALSARDDQALQELAGRWVGYLEQAPPETLADLCFTANAGRSHFIRRLAVTADCTTRLQSRLTAFVAGQVPAGIFRSEEDSAAAPRVVFLFTGQGSQYVGMGRQLFQTQPTFRKSLEQCAEILRPCLLKPLLEVLYPEPGRASPLDETAYTQPALFALEYSLAQLWRSWGIEPAAVLGHSVGEYVAACVAGVFSLEHGLKLMAERARLMQALPAGGEMAAVFADETQVAAVLARHDGVSLAALNGPDNTVISGAGSVVQAVLAELARRGIRAQRLTVSHAFHSPLMEPMLEAFEKAAAAIPFAAPRLRLISNLTGTTSSEMVTADYWRRHVRQPVRFAAGMQYLHEQGYNLFLEVGPTPTLLSIGRRCLPDGTGVWLPSLRRGQDDWPQLLESLGELYVRGASINWQGFDRDYPRRRIAAPTYPFQRQRYWIEAADTRVEKSRPATPGGVRQGAQPVSTPVSGTPSGTPEGGNGVAGPGDFVHRLRQAPPRERHALLLGQVRELAAGVLGLDPSAAIDPRQPLKEFGLDSLMALELRNRLAARLGALLPATLVFEHPSLEALTDHLARMVLPVEAAAPAREQPLRLAEGEPIAIIGIGCRFPGANGPDAFWRLLRDGVDAVTEVPRERWDIDDYYDPDPAKPGKMNTRWGGFLEGVDRFDPRFFRISDREATYMDPQQRLLAEVAWEALEDAGQPPKRLAGTRTGVFIGISGNDYALGRLIGSGRDDAYVASGNALSIAANRVSYLFDFQGPSLAVDTACSSSLVAVHLACRSLANGESTLALAGGVNLLLSPAPTVNCSKAGFMSPDGRCHTFDVRANGYVRGEGVGLVVLKPLSRALADNDPIYAIIRGSAVNQDGRSNGLTSPNGQAQEAVLRAAYAQADINPAEVQYIEAHGTGTILGDPIEARALGTVLGPARPADRPCALGSVKTNIGHLEAAAGVAGLIKVALALKHCQLPPSLHFREPNPYIPFAELPLRVQQTLAPWPDSPDGGGTAIAGVSSFGFGGTNAHVVLEGPPSRPLDQLPELDQPGLLPLSARSSQALRDLVRTYRDFLGDGQPGAAAPLRDVCYSAGVGRNHHEHRLALVARSQQEFVQQLDALGQGVSCSGTFSGRKIPGHQSRVIFVFADSPIPLEWSAVRELLEREPVFRATLAQCDELLGLQPRLDRLSEPEFARPSLCAVQVALATLWRSWGIEPDAAVASGVGEAAAAYVAGILTLAEALQLACQGGQEKQTTDSSSNGIAHGPEPAIPVFSTSRTRKPLADLIDDFAGQHDSVFLECGPGPVLGEDISRRLEQRSGVVIVPSLRAGEDERTVLLRALGLLYTLGHPVRWDRLFSRGGRLVRLPTYPWQHERYWIDIDSASAPPVQSPRAHTPDSPISSGPEVLDSWLYQLRWERKDRAERALVVDRVGHRSHGRWLLFTDRGGIGQALGARLIAAGGHCFLVSPGQEYRRLAEGSFQVCPGRADDMRRLFNEAVGSDSGGSHPRLAGIVYLWGLDAPGSEELTVAALESAQAVTLGSVLHLVQEMASRRYDPPEQAPRLWLVTRGAVAVGEEPSGVTVAQAPLWGFGRTLAAEHPPLWGGLVDLDPRPGQDGASELAGRLWDDIAAADGEDQLAWRGGQRYVARLAPRVAAESAPLKWRRRGAYLLTGGLGGLGLVVARWMVEQGARRLILFGRTPLPPRREWSRGEADSRVAGQIAAVRELEALGASVHLAAVDVADEAQLRHFLETWREESWPPIRGVVHLAGVVHPRPLRNQDVAGLVEELRSKVTGGWLLHRLLAEEQLDFLVFFSSAASVLSSPRLAAYAAANAFLDGLAHHRRFLGLPALSINWGAWGETGMATRLLGERDRTPTAQAPGRLSNHQGVALLGRLLQEANAGSAQVMATALEWDEWKQDHPEAARSPLVATWTGHSVDVPPGEPAVSAPGDRANSPRSRPELPHDYVAARTELEQVLVGMWREVLNLDRVGIHDNFFELGGDSIEGAILVNMLQERLGEFVHVLTLFDTQTVSDLAAYLREHYPAGVARMCGVELTQETTTAKPARQIGPAEVALFEQMVTGWMPQRAGAAGAKNSPAIFVLAPPRSGTTLLRVMLAGHARLFGPPELELLSFNTLPERKAFFAGRGSFRLEGSLRAIMEIQGCDAEQAEQVMAEYEDQGMTTQQFYRLLQGWIGSRVLVDKTPTYAMDRTVLERAEQEFEGALYLHLLRHPYGMIHSFEESKMSQWLFQYKHRFSDRELGELVWLVSHRNIVAFLEGVPKERQHRVRFEDLVQQPEATGRELCDFLGLEFDEDVVQPYRDKEARMTDGLHAVSKMIGDPKFHTHQGIDPSVADNWTRDYTEDFLGDLTREMARHLGYENLTPPLAKAPVRAAPPVRPAMTPIPRLSREDNGEQILANLDQMSDQDVDSLLRQMMNGGTNPPVQRPTAPAAEQPPRSR